MTAERRPPALLRKRVDALALGWLALSLLWAIVILVTDALAWPLALWIATTLGPLEWLRRKKEVADD